MSKTDQFPQQGGSYQRDPKTGKPVPVTENTEQESKQ
jgi:hypothetical protein